MAFLKTSLGTKVQKINEETLLEGLSSEEIKNLLQRYVDGKNIGFKPSSSLLQKYGF